MTASMTTESSLRDWRFGSVQAERLCAGLLEISGYSNVDPQATLGGPDGKKDIIARRDGKSVVAAVYFPPTEPTFSQIRAKYIRDRDGVAINGASGFVFFVNQQLTLGHRNALRALGGADDEIFHLERIRHLLDSPQGYGLRLEYLRRSMTPEEEAAYHSIQQQSASKRNEPREDAGRVLAVTAFPELRPATMRLPKVWDERPELDVLEGGVGQLELVLYELLRIDERGDLVLDADANEALVPDENRWWTDQDPPRVLTPAEDAGVASEFLATIPTFSGVAVADLAESLDPVVSALIDVDIWRHSPRWILRSWYPDQITAYLAVASASLAAWANEKGSGLLLYVDGTAVDQEVGIREAPGLLHSYLLCVTRSPAGGDELAAIHRLVLSCPGEGWCRAGGCPTVDVSVETALSPLLASAARSAGVAAVAYLHDVGSIYQQMYGSGGDDGYAEPLIELFAVMLKEDGWEVIEQSVWEGGIEELLVRRADDFLVLGHDPVTRQILLRDGTYALNGILDLLSDDGLITEVGERLVVDMSEKAVEQWGASCLTAAADALSGRIDVDRPPGFAPLQTTLLGLHPAGLGYVTTSHGDSLCKAQLAGLLRSLATPSSGFDT